MAATGSETAAVNGHHDNDHDHILRPRPRKPKHSQVSELVRAHSSSAVNGLLNPSGDGIASGLTRYVPASSAVTLTFVLTLTLTPTL